MPKADPKVHKVDSAGTTAVVSDEQFKEVLYETIAKMVKDSLARKGVTGGILSKPDAKRIFGRITELIFLRAVEAGYFRFPAGYGSLKLTKLRENAAVRVMPDGQQVKPKDERFKLRYTGGVAVMDMLGTNPHKYRRKTPRRTVGDDLDTATV